MVNMAHFNNRHVFVGSIGSDCNPIWIVIFSCLTKTDIAIGLAIFCKQRSFETPRTVNHTKSCLKLSFYRSIRIYRVDFEKIAYRLHLFPVFFFFFFSLFFSLFHLLIITF